MPLTVIQYVLPFLFALLPMQVLTGITVVILRSIAKKTTNKLDDEIISVLAKNLNVPDEPVDIVVVTKPEGDPK